MKTCAAMNVIDPETNKSTMVQSQSISPLEMFATPSCVKIGGG